MVKRKLTVKDIPHITVRELAYKIKSVDDYIGSGKGLEAADKRKPTLAFFLGAGASFESGIMLAGQMMKKFKEKIFEIHCPEIKTDNEKKEWLTKEDWYKDGKEEYGCLFEKAHATKAERQRFIENMIADKEPSFGYVVLANLLLRNYVNAVLTTNFDDLVYISATNFTGNRPIVYAYGILASEMKMTSPHSKVLKLHGDYLYSNIVNTGEEMFKQSQALSEPFKDTREAISSLNMERQVRTVFDNFGLLVIGYSGGDETVMQLLENVSKDNGFYWCYVKGYPPDKEVLKLVQRKEGRLVEIEGFDALMKEISDITDFRIDDLLDSLEQRKEKLKNSITKFDTKLNKESLDKYAKELKESKSEDSKENLSAADYLILGNQADDLGDFALAESYYRKAIELNPNSPFAYNNLGILLENYNRVNEAEQMFRKAIQLDSENLISLSNLGALLANDKTRIKEAEHLYGKAIELNPNDLIANNNLANLLSKDNSRHEEAEQLYRKVIELNPNDVRAYKGLGNLLSQGESKYKEAEQIYNKAIQLNPADAELYNNLGLLLAKDERRLGEAENEFNNAIKINPNLADAYDNLGTLIFKLNNDEKKAEQLHRKAIELKPNFANAYNNLGVRLSYDENRIDEAELSYRKAIEIDPHFAKSYYNLGVLLIEKKGNFFEAEQLFRRVIELDSNNKEAYNNLAALLIRDKIVLDYAEKLLHKALEIKPDYAEAHLNLGNIYLHLGKPKEAEKMCQKALELRPDYADAYFNLGIILTKDLRLSEAEKMFLKVIELKSDYAEAYLELGELYSRETSRIPEAKELFNKALKLKPNYAEAYNVLGNLFVREGLVDKAIENLQKAVENNPEEPAILLSLSAAYKKANDYKNVQKYADEARNLIKDNDFYLLACYEAILDKKEPTLEYLKKAIEKDPISKFSAKTDTEFDSIRDDERFREIVGKD